MAACFAVIAGAIVKTMRQKNNELSLDLEDGNVWTVPTAKATSSVLLRDKAGKLEYPD